jgi:LDH2 family malate/lactate/ureidoglycolate dehydrogenase
MPEGWVVDAAGAPITDPARAHEGFLVPMGGYKGSGLAIAIGLLAGVHNGAAFGADVVDHRHDDVTPTNTGQSILAIRADLFRPREEVLAEFTRHLCALRNSAGVDGRLVRLPGDEAARTYDQNVQSGVPVEESLEAELCTLAHEAGVESPFNEWRHDAAGDVSPR